MNNNKAKVYAVKYCSYVLILLALYVLQTTPGFLSVFGIKPNLVIPAVVCIAMVEGEFVGGLLGALGGCSWTWGPFGLRVLFHPAAGDLRGHRPFGDLPDEEQPPLRRYPLRGDGPFFGDHPVFLPLRPVGIRGCLPPVLNQNSAHGGVHHRVYSLILLGRRKLYDFTSPSWNCNQRRPP